jgi:hypothetical protein
MCEQESFTSLLLSWPHWQFELLVGFLETIAIDVLALGLAWPFVRKHWNHHRARDAAEGK